MKTTNAHSIDTPVISVIIPAYNAEEYIEETIQSVLDQAYSNIEILVIDDGSSDNTLQILEKYKSKLKISTQKNMGVSKARNTAVGNASGKWIAFVDSDDIWPPEKLSEQIEQIKNENWSHTNSVYFGHNQDGTTKRSDLTPQFGGNVFNHLITDNFITTSTVLIKRSTFLEYGGFDESLKALEDWKLWLEVSLKEPLNYNPSVLCKYRVTPGSTSRKAREVLPLHIQLINSIFEKHENKIKYGYNLKNKALYNSYSICSYIAEDSNDYKFSNICSYNAWLNNKYAISAIKRLLRTTLNRFTA